MDVPRLHHPRTDPGRRQHHHLGGAVPLAGARYQGSHLSYGFAFPDGIRTPSNTLFDAYASIDWLNGSLSLLGQKRYYRFNATQNDLVNLELSHPSGSLVGQVLVRAPGSQPFYNRSTTYSTSTNTTTRSSEMTPRFLTSTGEWVIEVTT